MPFTIGGDYIPKQQERPKGPYKVRKERRKKSFVTLIQSLPLLENEIKDLAKQLRRTFACGGAVKQGTIELQGDFTKEVETHIKQFIAQAKKS